jgi:hypothetical protein
MPRFIIVPVLMFGGCLLAFGAGVTELAAHAQMRPAQASRSPAATDELPVTVLPAIEVRAEAEIPVLPVVTVRPEPQITVLPVVTVRPSADDMAALRAEAVAISERHGDGTAPGPRSVLSGLGLDMPYYSFGKVLQHFGKD